LTTLHNQIWHEVYEEVFSNGFVIDSPLTLCHKDGKLCIIQRICIQNDEGKVLGIVIVARDVTKQKSRFYILEVYLRQVWILLLLSMRKGKSLTEIMH
jgi:hypothetical protein